MTLKKPATLSDDQQEIEAAGLGPDLRNEKS